MKPLNSIDKSGVEVIARQMRRATGLGVIAGKSSYRFCVRADFL